MESANNSDRVRTCVICEEEDGMKREIGDESEKGCDENEQKTSFEIGSKRLGFDMSQT